ncbi:putative phosphatase phospho1 isoform X1 [Stigmatopora argus]
MRLLPHRTGPKMTAAPPHEPRFLVLFDFDETLVNENSDDAVLRALPGQRLPDWLKNSYREGHYNEHMQQILTYMAEQGVSRNAVRSAVEGIPATPGTLALLHFLQNRQPDFELVVISDANMFFIDTWLKRAGVRQLFRKIFTNPASFDDGDDRLVLLPFHAHSCPRCPDNMCKQVILREYLAQRQRERDAPFQRVFYVGDGANDVCPSLALGPQDTVFPRKDFPMHRLLKSEGASFKANVVPWSSGEDVMGYLKKIIEER